MDLQAIDAIIKKCNRIDKKIGTRKNETQEPNGGVSILTTGQFILKLSDETIEKYSSGSLNEKEIRDIVENGRKRTQYAK